MLIEIEESSTLTPGFVLARLRLEGSAFQVGSNPPLPRPTILATRHLRFVGNLTPVAQARDTYNDATLYFFQGTFSTLEETIAQETIHDSFARIASWGLPPSPDQESFLILTTKGSGSTLFESFLTDLTPADINRSPVGVFDPHGAQPIALLPPRFTHLPAPSVPEPAAPKIFPKDEVLKILLDLPPGPAAPEFAAMTPTISRQIVLDASGVKEAQRALDAETQALEKAGRNHPAYRAIRDRNEGNREYLRFLTLKDLYDLPLPTLEPLTPLDLLAWQAHQNLPGKRRQLRRTARRILADRERSRSRALRAREPFPRPAADSPAMFVYSHYPFAFPTAIVLCAYVALCYLFYLTLRHPRRTFFTLAPSLVFLITQAV